MKNVFNNNDNFATIAGQIDQNQIEVINSVFRLAYPTSTLRGLAVGDAPTASAAMDAYLVTETGTVWGVAVEVDQFIKWNGTGWDVLPLKLPDLASGITASTTAAGVSFDNTGTAFTGATVQAVLGEADARIAEAENTVDAVYTTVEEVVTQVGNTETAISELDTRIGDAETAISDLQTTVAGIETLLAAI